MDAKTIHEDEALEDWRSELAAQGHVVQLVGHPDRKKKDFHPLTVDAVFNVDGEPLAMDHCLLSRTPELPTAMKHAEKVLTSLLDPVAQEAGCLLLVTYLQQIGEQGTKWGAGYFEQFVDAARRAVETGQQEWLSESLKLGDRFSSVKTFDTRPPWAFGIELVTIPETTGDPAVSAQVMAGLREPMLKKMDGQLRVAKELGYRTALLLDQVMRPGGNETAWNARPETITLVVNDILAEHRRNNPPILDQVWLRQLPTPSATRRVTRLPIAAEG